MPYTNENSLSNNLEVDLLRSMIVILTVIMFLLSLLTDSNAYTDIEIWMYFIMVAPVVFIFTLLIKPFPQTTMIGLSLLLIFLGITVKKIFIHEDIFNYKTVLLILHFVVINFSFFKTSKSLQLEDVDADLSMYKPSKEKGSSSRKLTRRRNRRASSRAKNTVKIKSGQYRG